MAAVVYTVGGETKSVDSRWVKFKEDHENGYAKYRAGQVAFIKDGRVLKELLEGGAVEPSQPAEGQKEE